MLPGLVPLGYAVSPAFGSEDPLAPVGHARWHHRTLTDQACQDEGWTPGAADEAAWATVGVDLYSYHPIWRAYGGPTRWRTGSRLKKSLDALHFDDLGGVAEVEEIWHRILGGCLVALDDAVREGDVGTARHLVGVSLHAVQDFYSHSTWIDLPERRDTTWLARWERTRTDPDPAGPGNVLTGGFGHQHPGSGPAHGKVRLTASALTRLPALVVSPAVDRIRHALGRPESPGDHRSRLPRGVKQGKVLGINLDSRWQAPIGADRRDQNDLDGDTAFDLAYDLARRESRTWIRLLEEHVTRTPIGRSFWAQVTSGAHPQPWTRAFERSDRRACDFMSAGQYPPSGAVDSREWFLRVTVDQAPGRSTRLQLHPGAEEAFRLHERVTTLGPVRSPAQLRLTGLPRSTPLRVLAFRRAPDAVSTVVFDARVAGTELRVDLDL